MPATYTLPPALYAKAVALGRLLVDLHFTRELLPIVLLILLLEFHLPAWLAGWTHRRTPRPWLQVILFSTAFLLLMSLLELPVSIASHHVLLRFGLSIQHWPSWFADAGKSIAIQTIVGTLIAALLFWRIRRSPQNWWLQGWTLVVVFMIAGIVITPVVIDPLFDKFEPLAQTDPALVAQLERVVARSGIAIPPERIFLMRASAKTTESNAYVTGFGASKRVVVWDTMIRSSSPDEICFVFAHEMGHYVLRHVLWSIVFSTILLLSGFWLAAQILVWLLRRFGTRWHIASLHDPAALAVMLLLLMTAQILTEPIASIWSRHIEHAADVYGQEAIHSIVADPAATAAQSFQRLGEANLSTPERRPFVEWWAYNHPAIADRITFAAAYDPWAANEHPKYFDK